MVRIDRDTMQQLWNEQSFPCVSIYLPILREGNEVVQTPIRLNSLINQAQDHLRLQDIPFPRIQKILAPAIELLDQPLFWAFARDGLAIFCSEETSMTLSLAHPVQEQMTISDHFVTRPLLEIDSANTEYLLLAIGRGAVKVYRGSRDRLIQIPVNDLPESLDTIISTYSFEKQRQQYGGSTTGHGASPGLVNHGVENSKDRDRIMLETYCRQVDERILDHWKSENLPLVVASVDYLFAIYRKVSKNPQLLPVNIPGSPDHLSEIELRKKAWTIVRNNLPNNEKTDWDDAQNHLGSDRVRQNIRQIIEAADNGKVAQLFIPKGQILTGRFDQESRQIIRPQLDAPVHPFQHEDLIEIAAIKTMQNGGRVYPVDASRLPDGSDALAIMRY